MHKGIKGPDCNPYGIKISCKPRLVPIPANCKIGPRCPGFGAYSINSVNHAKKDTLNQRHSNKRSYSGSTLIPDICKNYNPIKTELDRYVQGAKSSRFYKCNNFENHEGMKDGCLFCSNWVDINGEDKGHKSSPEKMVSYYVSLYQNDAGKFIRFFQKRRDWKDKKKILEGILECEFANEDVIKYLDEHWPDLVREVGINLI